MLHQEAPLPVAALCPGKASRDAGPLCTFLSSAPDLISAENPRRWKPKGSPLAFEGWLMGAAPTATLSPPGHNPS